MNKAIALAGLGLGLVVLGTRKSSSWPGVPYAPTNAPPLPNPEYVPAVYEPEASPFPSLPGLPAVPAVPPASIMSRVVTAASSGNPTAMRTEAGKLRAEGWPDQAGDLEELARRTDQLRAAVSPVPAPVKPPAAAPAPVKPPPVPAPAPTPLMLPTVSPPIPVVPVKPPATVVVAPPPPDPRPPVVPPGMQTPPAAVSMLGLLKGAVGPGVTAWQSVLRSDGFANIPAESNTFGPETDAATRALQLDRGMVATGIVDQQTLNLAPLPAILGKRVLMDGSRGGAVKAWQRVLVTSGQTQVLIDGWFAGETINGTKFWQKSRKLDPDGKVGPATIAAMGIPALVVSVLPITTAAVTAAVEAIYPTTFDPTKWRTYLKSGMVGADVSEWQTILSRDGFVSHPDGKFGPETLAATKAWQLSRQVKPADGIVGPDVRKAIVLVVGKKTTVAGVQLQGNSSSAIPPARFPWSATAPAPWRELPTFTQAPTEQVSPERALAAKLAHNLFFAVEGGEDKALVRLFQEINGLQATGAYGPSTGEALIAYGLIPPHPRAWPSKGSTKVRARYVAALREQARRDPSRAVEWNAAAARAVAQ
jgi:peptidoglycan hydrolase-like protein with peptidoglycan-binding domain